MKMSRRVATIALLLGSLTPATAQEVATGPVFRPDEFFQGTTRSQGVLSAIGSTRQVAVLGTGRRTRDGALVLVQDIAFSDGERQRRVWRFLPLAGGRYQATANDVIGVADGEVRGNVFYFRYTLKREPGSLIDSVDVDHEMVLQPVGRTVVNRASFAVLGFPVATLVETFKRAPGRVSSRRRDAGNPSPASLGRVKV